MPIYAYRCEACGFAKDVLQKMSDPQLTVCLSCGASSFKKQVTAAGFQLKGTGWYATDFRNGAGTTAPTVGANGESGKDGKAGEEGDKAEKGGKGDGGAAAAPAPASAGDKSAPATAATAAAKSGSGSATGSGTGSGNAAPSSTGNTPSTS